MYIYIGGGDSKEGEINVEQKNKIVILNSDSMQSRFFFLILYGFIF